MRGKLRGYRRTMALKGPGPGRPTADVLEQHGKRCQGVTRAGSRCKGATLPGLSFCSHHLDDLERKRKADTGNRLIAMTALALDTLDEVMRTGRRNEDRVRAAGLVLARTLPVSGDGAVGVQVNILGTKDGDGDQYSESAEIRKRLLELRESHERMARAQGKSAADQLRDLRADDVIDAEIITEEPTAAQDIPAPGAEPWPQREAAG